ncbi:MAG TPA: thermonuclease family protein [Gammaproteobacteria bacterium]|jgi:endonuclease YncB( thermonuclease family)
MSALPVKRASLLGALFFFALPLFASTECGPHQLPDWQIVRHVHDGDSLKLADQRKIRLIGINTPELARDDQPEQAFAQAARMRLDDEIKRANNRVGLVYDAKLKDRYGRTLAHLFLQDGTNITELLLRQGLGSLVAISPNLKYNECYVNAQQHARKNELNLWRKGNTRIIDVDKSSSLTRGFQHVRGTVTNVGRRGRNTWLDLGDALSIQIADNDLEYFKLDRLWPLSHLQGRIIEVSGWIYTIRGQYRLRIHHPSVFHALE